MNRTTLLALAERVEAATGADRGLDSEIHHAVLNGVGVGSYGAQPAYTASLDAAMSLVPSGWSFMVDSAENRLHAQAKLGRSYPTNANAYAEASTPPLALTAASLRAIAGIMTE